MFETVIFTLGGRPVLLIDLVSSLLGLTCVFLAGRNSKYNFWVGYLYTAALFLLFWHTLIFLPSLGPAVQDFYTYIYTYIYLD